MARSDIEIWREILDSLRRDERIEPGSISVDVTNGVVTLVGEVSSFPEKTMGAELASRVRGVTSVVDNLRVVPAVPRSDVDVAADVRAALTRDVRIDMADRIGVTVNRGRVVLAGTVESVDQKRAAAEDAQSTPGVVEVVDEIEVIPDVVRHDAEIENDIRRVLIADTIVDASNIQIHVTNGLTRLTGTVPSLYQKQAAEDDAWAQPGVRGVVNELRVQLPSL